MLLLSLTVWLEMIRLSMKQIENKFVLLYFVLFCDLSTPHHEEREILRADDLSNDGCGRRSIGALITTLEDDTL